MTNVEFFFDCSSAWTYLAFEGILPIADRQKAAIVWRPILVGGIFNAVNSSVYERRANPTPAKASYALKDLNDWAAHSGLRIEFPPPSHPVNSVKCMRICLVLEPGKLVSFVRAAFEALFRDSEDLGDESVLIKILRSIDVDPRDVMSKISSSVIKQALRDNTNEAIERGAFGSPTIFVDRSDMYFGNDRLMLVEAALARKNN
ncbi:MAG: oxidoreductase [Bradyrhizobium sp.]|nr:oxidoreductase [Bradyrhizobium sp.]